MKKYTFSQHIRTSSKSRRGFRTYQMSTDIHEPFEKNLSILGAYIPSLQENDLEELPVLFLFTPFDKKYIICKSSYIGLDLHSFPPRKGNYIAHSLVYNRKEPFNLVELYEKYPWKTGEQVKYEDNGNVRFNIDPKEINLTNEQIYIGYFNDLLQDKHRANLFKRAIEIMLTQDRKLIIIDEKKYLQSWCMSLLQSFPINFVFENIRITSLANSNVLFDVCNILCVGLENKEKMVKYEDIAYILDISEPKSDHVKSSYAHVVAEHAKSEKSYKDLKNNLFSRISDPNISRRDYDKHAFVLQKISEVAEMEEKEFTDFIQLISKDKSYCASVCDTLFEKGSIDKFPKIWEIFIRSFSIVSVDTYWYLNDNFTLAPHTDTYWLTFEKEIIKQKQFTSIQELLQFKEVSKELDQSFNHSVYSTKAINIIKRKVSISEKEHEISILRSHSDILTLGLEDEKSLEHIIESINIYKIIDKKSSIDKLVYFYENLEKILDIEYKDKIIDLIRLTSIRWKTVFGAINNHQTDNLKKIHHLKKAGYNFFYPNVALIDACINPKIIPANLAELVKKLTEEEKKTIFKLTRNKSIKRAIIMNKNYPTVQSYLSAVKDYVRIVSPSELLNNFLSNNNHDDREIWKLLSQLVKKKDIPNIDGFNIEKIISKVLDYLSISEKEIPNGFERFALKLADIGWLKRRLPVKYMYNIYEELKSIGTITDIRDLNERRIKRPITHKELRLLIKKPWEYYYWRELYYQLTPEEIGTLPDQMSYLFTPTGDQKSSKNNLSPEAYAYIFCEYILFLVIDDLKDELVAALSETILEWKEYEFILARLTYTYTNKDRPNNSLSLFMNPKNKNYRFKGKHAKWDFDE